MATLDSETIDASHILEGHSESPSALGLVWMRRNFLLSFVFCCVLGTTIAVLLWPPHSKSNVNIMPPTTDPNSMLATAMGMTGGGGASAIAGDVIDIKTKGA